MQRKEKISLFWPVFVEHEWKVSSCYLGMGLCSRETGPVLTPHGCLKIPHHKRSGGVHCVTLPTGDDIMAWMMVSCQWMMM